MAQETSTQTTKPVAGLIEEFAITKLREEYPYMLIAKVQDMARQCRELLSSQIAEA